MKELLSLIVRLESTARPPGSFENDLIEDFFCKLADILTEKTIFSSLQFGVIASGRSLDLVLKPMFLTQDQFDAFRLIASAEERKSFSRRPWNIEYRTIFRYALESLQPALKEAILRIEHSHDAYLRTKCCNDSHIVLIGAGPEFIPHCTENSSYRTRSFSDTDVSTFVAFLFFGNLSRPSQELDKHLCTAFSLFYSFYLRDKHDVIESEKTTLDKVLRGMPDFAPVWQLQQQIQAHVASDKENQARLVASEGYWHNVRHSVGEYGDIAKDLLFFSSKAKDMCPIGNDCSSCKLQAILENKALRLSQVAEIDLATIKWARIAARGLVSNDLSKEPSDIGKLAIWAYRAAILQYLKVLKLDEEMVSSERTEDGKWLAPLLFGLSREGICVALEEAYVPEVDDILPLSDRLKMWSEACSQQVEICSIEKVFPHEVRLFMPSPPPDTLMIALRELFFNAFKYGRKVLLMKGKRITEVTLSLYRENNNAIVLELVHPAYDLNCGFYEDSLLEIGRGLGTNIRFFSSLAVSDKGLTLHSKSNGEPRFVWQCRFSPSKWLDILAKEPSVTT